MIDNYDPEAFYTQALSDPVIIGKHKDKKQYEPKTQAGLEQKDYLKQAEQFAEKYIPGNDTPGYIAAGLTGLGSLANSLIALNAIDKQRVPVAPMPQIAQKRKTRYNVNADLAATREAASAANEAIWRKTASSQVARKGIIDNLFARSLADLKTYQTKEEKENEAINKDIENREKTINANILAGNAYRQSLADYYSNLASSRADAWLNLSNGLGTAANLALNNIGLTRKKRLDAISSILPFTLSLGKSGIHS